MRRIIPSLLLVFFIASCGGDRQEAYRVREEVIDGVRNLTSPDTPRDGIIVYSAVEELSIGVESGEEPYMFNRPYDLRVDTDGSLYVMEWGDCHIRVFDDQGLHIRTIGRKGQGPGEFSLPAYFDLSEDGRIFVMDSRQRRVIVFDADGRPISDFRLEGYHSGMACDRDNRLFFHSERDDREVTVKDEWQDIGRIITLHRSRDDGSDKVALGDFEGEVRRLMRTDTGSMTVSPPFQVVWAAAEDGRLVVGFNREYRFSLYNPEGALAFRFGRDFTPLPNPRYKEGSGMDRDMPVFRSRLPLVFDDSGNLWIPLTVPEDHPRSRYDVFSADGIYLTQVELPFYIRQFRQGRAYAIVTPEEGFPMVKRYRLEEGSPGPSGK